MAGGALKRLWFGVFPRYVRLCDVRVGWVFRLAPQKGAAELLLLAEWMEAGELIDMQVRVRRVDSGQEMNLRLDALRGVWRVG